jgi:hypothetical protein
MPTAATLLLLLPVPVPAARWLDQLRRQAAAGLGRRRPWRGGCNGVSRLARG